MTMGRRTFGEPRRHRRRQAMWRVFRFGFAMAAVFGVGIYGYQVGVSASQARTDQLEADLIRFQRANLDLRDDATLARQQSEQAQAALASVQQRLATEVPSGVAADLWAQLQTQLDAGIAPERLALLIDAAGLEDACQTEPETKRLLPRTPISTGPLSYVRFDGRLIITAEGESARNQAGLAEAWFDPAKPVRLKVRTIDGAVTDVEGIVPLTHQMAFDGREYRLSVVSSAPHFVEITAQACELPQPSQEAPTRHSESSDGGSLAATTPLGPVD
jgi:hypothetical protein